MLIPTDWAAIILSLIAIIALPCLERTTLVITINVRITKIYAIVKLLVLSIPFKPPAPPVNLTLFNTERIISPKASVTIAK